MRINNEMALFQTISAETRPDKIDPSKAAAICSVKCDCSQKQDEVRYEDSHVVAYARRVVNRNRNILIVTYKTISSIPEQDALFIF